MEIPTELLHEILLKLPTMDVARCCSVSRLWCDIAMDPSFRGLHANANHVAAPLLRDVEALLVSQHQDQAPHGGYAEASVLRVSSSLKPMCRVANPSGYRLANVCNGLLCFASLTNGEAPAIICNPVNGEELELPRAPPLCRRHLFALGFSPSTKEYKLFRLSSSTTNDGSYVDVYTLGDNAGWRQHPHIPQHCPIYGVPPVLIDGKLCIVTSKPTQRIGRPSRILVMDVASETCRTYRLPNQTEGLPPANNVRVNAFELHGRLAVAIINVLNWHQPELQVWLLPPWDRLQPTKDDDDDKLYWDRRYSFRLDAPSSPGSDLILGCRPSDAVPRAAWLDGDETLCYTLGDQLYEYDTRRYMPFSNFGFLPWNQKQQLSMPPSSVPSTGFNFYGGYRPTLLSPHVFAPTVQSLVEQGGEQEREENTTILLVPQCHKPKRHCSPVDPTDGLANKRICCSIIHRPCRCYLARLHKLR